MRVIAGKYRRLALNTPKNTLTRPTLDRTKEALFSILGDLFDKTVLDLFAGSGALGIEAMSRGARKVYFNDFNKQTYMIIKQNLMNIKAPNEEYELLNLDYLIALKKLENIKFDLVILDPPYNMRVDKLIFEYLLKNQMLNKGATIVIESDCQLEYPNAKTYQYGTVYFTIFKVAL